MLIKLLRSLLHPGRSDAGPAMPPTSRTQASPASLEQALASIAAGLERANHALTQGNWLAHQHYQLAGQQYIAALLASPRYDDPARLERSGFKAYSQSDEDGILAEVFRRIGSTNRVFLETGVENGLENNTLYLLHNGWRGCWIECDDQCVEQIRSGFHEPLADATLKLRHARVDCANVNALIAEFGLPQEIDLLSIDIDGNDYHVWQAITSIDPRVVVIEYNARFAPPTRWVMPYDAKHVAERNDYFGASLSSLANLGEAKGYALVGCNITGSNAFFVRKDIAHGKFQQPPSAENFYHPARYFLTPAFVSGHPPRYGRSAPQA